MKSIRISQAIVPVHEFKASTAKYLAALPATGPLVITVNGKAAGVVVSPADYDRMIEREAFLEAIDEGIQAADGGKLLSADEVRARLGLPRR